MKNNKSIFVGLILITFIFYSCELIIYKLLITSNYENNEIVINNLLIGTILFLLQSISLSCIYLAVRMSFKSISMSKQICYLSRFLTISYIFTIIIIYFSNTVLRLYKHNELLISIVIIITAILSIIIVAIKYKQEAGITYEETAKSLSNFNQIYLKQYQVRIILILSLSYIIHTYIFRYIYIGLTFYMIIILLLNICYKEFSLYNNQKKYLIDILIVILFIFLYKLNKNNIKICGYEFDSFDYWFTLNALICLIYFPSINKKSK